MDFALPAIGLWPQRRAEVGPAVSRFGGVPMAPKGWQWPVAEEEPRLFVGQINCAELRGLPGAEQLPASGLLAFFGDHDAVTGCFPFDSHCVFYWPDVHGLVRAKAPIEPIRDLPSLCDRATAASRLASSGQRCGRWPRPEQTSARGILRHLARRAPPRHSIRLRLLCKLQQASWLARFGAKRRGDVRIHAAARLILQVDAYCNGETAHGWGPGGSLFYVLPDADLRAHDFTRCELEGQFT